MIDVDNTQPEDYQHDQEPDQSEYVGIDYSDCCGAMIHDDTDICSECHEHCGIEEFDDLDETPEEMNDRLRSMGF